MTRLPFIARCLLRLAPAGTRDRAQVSSDLLDLASAREATHGKAYARRRLYGDILSLWFVAGERGERRQVSRASWWRDAGLDLRYAVRLFARRPAMLVLTITGLALGLGITTATFSILNAAFLRSDGIVDPDRVPGILRTTERGVSTAWTYDQFLRLREGSTMMQVEATLSDAATFRTSRAFEDVPAARVSFVSGGFFTALGGTALLGRTLEPADEQATGPMPIVMSHLWWRKQMAADPAVVGQTYWLGRTQAIVVGVMPPGFTASSSRDIAFWTPLTAYGPVYGAHPSERAPRTLVEVFGRLNAGIEMAAAEAQLGGVAAALSHDRPASDPYRARLDPEFGLGRMQSSTTLTIVGFVSGLIGLVLLLALANVATVLTAAAMTRDREMGVRLAMGAGRGRILRQLITEGLALGALSAVLGMTFAWWATPVIVTMLDGPSGIDYTPDRNVFLFVMLATLAVGVGAGLAPAWHGRGTDLLTPLKGDGPRSDRPSRRRLRFSLLLTQATASVVLIVLATLFVRATWRAASIDVGLDARGLHAATVSVGYADESGERIRSYWSRALTDLAASPGIRSVALVEHPPYGDGFHTGIRTVGGRQVRIYHNRTTSTFFDTAGLRLLAGRIYTPEEVRSKAPVAVVSQSFAKTYWGGKSPLGEIVDKRDSPGVTVVGVVSDMIPARLREASALAVYKPLDPSAEVFARLLVRAEDGPEAVQRIRDILERIDPLANVRLSSVEEGLREEMKLPGTLATLASFVGAVAIVLCVIGIYGITSSIVGQRTKEIGVRVALGAERRDVLRMLLWDSLRPVVFGLMLGGSLAFAAGRVVAGILYGVSPGDPLALAGAALLLLASTGAAALVPSRRAAAVDPAFVLRQS